MAENTSIAWCDHTFNPWIGCTKISEGCKNCYAEKVSKRFGGDHWGNGKPRKKLSDNYWAQPVKWEVRAKKIGIRERVFCGSMCDVFDIPAGPASEFLRLLSLVSVTPNLDWLFLTKRPQSIRAEAVQYHPNIWLGTTVENSDQKWRMDMLRELPATVRFLSCEPLLEDLGKLDLRGIHWVIAGAESGPGARPMYEDWVRSLRDQCQAADVAFLYKQRIENGKKVTLPPLDGRQWAEFPKGGST